MDNELDGQSHAQNAMDDWNQSQKASSKAFVFGGKLKSTDTLKPFENTSKLPSSAPNKNNDTSKTTPQNNQFPPITGLRSNLKDFKVKSDSRLPFPSQSPYIEFKLEERTFFLELLVSYLELSPLSFGRSADIILNHSSCSRSHAKISIQCDNEKQESIKFYITDTSSSNGTFLNGGKLSANIATKLEDNDELSFGLSEEIFYFKDPRNGNYKTNLQPKKSEETPSKRTFKIMNEDNNHEEQPNKKFDSNNNSNTHLLKLTPERIRCRHILKKHIESRNPFDTSRNKRITRTKQEAIEEIHEILREVSTKPSIFPQIAVSVSECSSSRNGGDLGYFTKGQMQKAFEDVSFSLKVGEISKVVDTSSGIHIILRIE